MDDLITALLSLNPLWVFIAIITGLITGFLTADIHLDRKTIIALALYDIPFVLIRILILIFFGPVISLGSGYVGAILFNLYLFSVYIARKVRRG